MGLIERCACGAVTYRLTESPLFTQTCHCLDCQRTTGSAFVIHVVAAERDLEVSGEIKCGLVPTGSGAGCELHYCAACGGYIWVRYRYHQKPVIAIRAGTLDDTCAVSPGAQIFVRSKQPWIALQDNVPQYETGCSREDVWPEASIERYNTLPDRK